MKTCFLHLGFHKTATTSFQNTCGANRQILENHGIIIPDFCTESGQLSFNHTFPIHNIYERPAKQATYHQNNLRAWKKLLNSKQNILISGEGILKMPMRSLKNLLKDINNSGFQIKPFACVRTPYSFINSALQNTIKNGAFHSIVRLGTASSTDFNLNMGTIPKIPSSLALVKKGQKLFGDSMIFCPFSRATNHKGGPVAFLLHDGLGIPVDDIEMTIANQSLCNTTARLINCLNSNDQLKEPFNLRRVKQIIDKFVFSDKFLLTQSEFEFIQPAFESLQINISDSLGPSYIDEKICFSKPLTADEINETLDQCPQQLRESIRHTKQYQSMR